MVIINTRSNTRCNIWTRKDAKFSYMCVLGMCLLDKTFLFFAKEISVTFIASFSLTTFIISRCILTSFAHPSFSSFPIISYWKGISLLTSPLIYKYCIIQQHIIRKWDSRPFLQNNIYIHNLKKCVRFMDVWHAVAIKAYASRYVNI